MQILNKWLRLFCLKHRGIYAKPTTRRLILALVFFLAFVLLLSTDLTADKVSVEEGQVSDKDIIAPRTVSYIDAQKTKKLENDVLATVADVYDLDVSVLIKAEDTLMQLFSTLKIEPAKNDDGSVGEDKRRELVAANSSVKLSDESLGFLLAAGAQDRDRLHEVTLGLLRRSLQRGVLGDELDITKKHIAIEVMESDLNYQQRSVANTLIDQLLVPNMILNVKETEKRKQSAVSSVEPVRETIRKGQVIVRRGDIITPQQIAMMGELGLHKGQVNRMRITGLMVYVILIMALVMIFLYKFEPKTYKNELLLFLLGLIMLIALLLGKAAYSYSYFVAPIATGALLAAILINPRVGMIVSVALAFLYAVIANYELRAVGAVLLGSFVGVYTVSRMAHGYSLTKTGMWIAAVNFIFIGATGFLVDIDRLQICYQSLFGILAGIAVAVITTGVLPYLEHAFNITTPIKLLELGQPNQPLLQRLLLEAPGTYHHSVLLGNLAEAAADVIGADPVLVRVGAYYHDIGKIKRPYFFVENQFGAENPHDKLAPSLSTLIVTSHVKDGVELCREYKLPRPIMDIVEQHHGTLLASFFYRQASESEHGDCVIEADFRYEGPKPQTKEAALIMIADACEAAVRSLGKPNANRVEAMVRKIIRERLNDGQFDECNLTLRDLTEIGDVYTRILSSMFHSRIEYPESIKEIERKNKQNGNSVREIPARVESGGEAERGGSESHK